MSEARSPISLLIIDDNQGSLELLSSALAQPDLEILTASDPEQGLELFHTRHPQIVLTDLMMPNISGMEVLERIIEDRSWHGRDPHDGALFDGDCRGGRQERSKRLP